VKLLTRKRESPQLAPVSVDALVAVVGGTAQELVARFGSVGDDWLGRPMIAFADARQAHQEWVAAGDRDVLLRIRYESYREDHEKRRSEVALAARADARAHHRWPARGGEETMRLWNAEWAAERAALAAFDLAEPVLLLSQFRAREKESA
jgi:hypothetical protein